jgi:hypothetical protein
MIFLDDKWMINQIDELSNECWQQNWFCKKLNKRNKMEFYLEKLQQKNFNAIYQCILHISLI